jgi:hypothetical protein
MAGENSLFAAYGFQGTSGIPGGAATFRVNAITYGIAMDYNEKESATQRTIYFQRLLQDNFAIELVFHGWDEYNQASSWFNAYSTFISDPTNSTVNPMAVIIPYLNFAGVGVPHVGISMGDQMVELVYVMNVVFEGTFSELAPTNASYFTQATAPGNEAQNFYPSSQVAGQAAPNEIVLYNAPSNGGLYPSNQGGSQTNPPVTPTPYKPTGPGKAQ